MLCKLGVYMHFEIKTLAQMNAQIITLRIISYSFSNHMELLANYVFLSV